MRFPHTVFVLATLLASVSAHFQLTYPPPRGEFVEDEEPNFCDGYNTPTSNRTQFPLQNGFIVLTSEHAQWTAGVLLASNSSASSFNDFTQVTPFASATGEGDFCLTLDFSSTNASNLQDGTNVTIQILFNGGDGNLYQCADLTLLSNASTSGVSCQNSTESSSGDNSASALANPLSGLAGVSLCLLLGLASLM